MSHLWQTFSCSITREPSAFEIEKLCFFATHPPQVRATRTRDAAYVSWWVHHPQRVQTKPRKFGSKLLEALLIGVSVLDEDRRFFLSYFAVLIFVCKLFSMYCTAKDWFYRKTCLLQINSFSFLAYWNETPRSNCYPVRIDSFRSLNEIWRIFA